MTEEMTAVDLTDEEWVELDGMYVHQTEKAVAVDVGTKARTIWIPKSQISFEQSDSLDEILKGTPITLYITEWIAGKLGV